MNIFLFRIEETLQMSEQGKFRTFEFFRDVACYSLFVIHVFIKMKKENA